MRRWPWIAILLGALALLSPVGLDFFHSAFLTNDSLSRAIARPIFLSGVAVWVALALIEFIVRWRLAARRQRAAAQ
jgi:hypothetical protein